MTNQIKILVLVAVLAGGGIIVGQLGDIVTPNQLNKLEFKMPDITLQDLKDGCDITTSTDEFGRVYKSGVECEIEPYLFPVASSSFDGNTTTTFFILEEKTGQVRTTLTGFFNCLDGMYGTSTRPFCLKEYVVRAIRNKLETHKDSERGRLNELKREARVFEFDITIEEITEVIKDDL